MPKNAEGKLPAIAVCGPFGAVKEQAALWLPMPEDAPWYFKDYHAYYKTERGYHPRSLNSNGGWNVIGCQSFMNMPILQYSNEIRSAVMVLHGNKAHSCYFGKDAYAAMMNGNKYQDNKKLLLVLGANHTDLYAQTDIIPFDKWLIFFEEYEITEISGSKEGFDMVKQTAGRDALDDSAPKFAQLNDDVLFGEVCQGRIISA